MSPWLLLVCLAGHGGEDHGATPAPPSAQEAVHSASATSPLFEAVVRVDAFADKPSLRLLLSEWATNIPVEKARVELSLAGPQQYTVSLSTERSPGVYETSLPPLVAGTYTLAATVAAGERVDALAFSALELQPGGHDDHDDDHGASTKSPLAVVQRVLLVLIGPLLVGVFLMWRARKRGAAASPSSTPTSALLLCIVLAAGTAQAHGGEEHDHGDAKGPAAVVGGRAVFLPKESQFLLGVRTEVVSEHGLAPRVVAPGFVRAAAMAQAAVHPPHAGRVVATAKGLPALGSDVKKGQVLAILEGVLSTGERATFAAEAAGARATIQSAAGRLAAAAREEARVASLGGLASTRERDAARVEVQAAQAELEAAQARARAFDVNSGGNRVELIAPLSGVLADLNVSVGELVDVSRRLFLIVDPTALQVEARIPEGDLQVLNLDTSAIVESSALPGRSFAAELHSQGLVIDDLSRSLKVLFSLPHPSTADMSLAGPSSDLTGFSGLKVGMRVNVAIRTGNEQARVAIPTRAVLTADGRSVVFVHAAAEQFERREVALGVRDGDRVEITAGLLLGDRVVIDGAWVLKNAPAAER